jgi:hypothetical protein
VAGKLFPLLLLAVPCWPSTISVPFSSTDVSSFFVSPTNESDGFWEIPLQPWEGPDDVLSFTVSFSGFSGALDPEWPPACAAAPYFPHGTGNGGAPQVVEACSSAGSWASSVDVWGLTATFTPPQPLMDGDEFAVYVALSPNCGYSCAGVFDTISMSGTLLVDPADPVSVPEPGSAEMVGLAIGVATYLLKTRPAK